MRVAVGQFSAGTNKAANLEAAESLIRAAAAARSRPRGAAGVHHVLRGYPGADAREWAEAVDGPFAVAITEAARSARITVVAGMTETLPGEARASNPLLAISETGGNLGVYRKIQLYDAFGYRESERIKPAAHAEPLVFEFGGGLGSI